MDALATTDTDFMIGIVTQLGHAGSADQKVDEQALKRYRTGGEQKVTVKRVTVNEGGQAIVGNVSGAPTRGTGKSEKG